MFSLSTTCSALVPMITEEYLCIFSLLLSTSGCDEPKGAEVIGRRQEESVEALSLVPIETCLKSFFFCQMAGRESRLAAPESLPQAGEYAGALRFVSSSAQFCVQSAGQNQAPGILPQVAFFWLLVLGEVGTVF